MPIKARTDRGRIQILPGDSVTWTSQSAGILKTKTGVVEQVVEPKSMPARERFVQLYKSSGVGLPRDHESYVVRVPGKTAKSAGKLYWPRVNALAHTIAEDDC